MLLGLIVSNERMSHLFLRVRQVLEQRKSDGEVNACKESLFSIVGSIPLARDPLTKFIDIQLRLASASATSKSSLAGIQG
jgi:hypothetical protein